ncbi:glycosyltransferase family 2 protein [Niameybacter massiliensis]|uniref:glycosyltransferase family 2 protein n=1 Tax=Niameybacter massiliensis TaxID=1658108 RepID=UPI0006B5D030|nr:glycosyltransferase [Niameybacter massiliensis]
MKKVSVLIPVFNQEVLIRKAITSIPQRDDLEIIVCDDASTDKTVQVIESFSNIKLLKNSINKGIGHTVNKLLDSATGEYIVLLGSDDYFYTEVFNHVINTFLYSDINYDIVYFNLEINNGTVWCLTESTKYYYCGSVKFIRRCFIGTIRCPEIRYAEDYPFFIELMKKSPKEIFTNQIVKHYNFPRINSLVDEVLQGSTVQP